MLRHIEIAPFDLDSSICGRDFDALYDDHTMKGRLSVDVIEGQPAVIVYTDRERPLEKNHIRKNFLSRVVAIESVHNVQEAEQLIGRAIH